jgi:hypothetical protein
LASLTIVACSSGADKRTDSTRTEAGIASGGADLTGAGATFPFPLYSRWVSEYAAATGVKINYQQIGSGGGIKQLQEQTVDFGASDAPMSDSDIAHAKGGPVIHIPTVVGVVAQALGPRRRRHLPRQGHEVERFSDRELESRRHVTEYRRAGRPPFRRKWDDIHLFRLSLFGERSLEEQSGERERALVAGWNW